MVGPVTTHETIDDELVGLLASWLPSRRWFPVKGSVAELTVVGGLALTDPLARAQVRVLLVRAVAPGIDTLVQVPVALYAPADVGPGTGSLIGTAGDPPVVVVDACGDPAFLRAWLAAAQGPGFDADAARARVLTGEQSNTSVIVPSGSATTSTGGSGAAILKVFRVPSPGANPDVDVPRALAELGWSHVPRPLAWLEAGWPGDGALRSGHLGVLSELVADAEDGFELACSMARRRESFAALTHELGGVVAGMHAALRAALPVRPTDSPTERARWVGDAVLTRFRWAAGLVPELDRYAGRVEQLAERTADLTGVPAPQRVHGDLHLGQVLRARDTWFVTDFEGEPLAPIEVRTRPDLALRDVAGMLRSIDYAAAVGGADDASTTSAHGRGAWAHEARRALLEGYAAALTHDERPDDATATGHASDSGSGTRRPEDGVRAQLLTALELDKALYEAVYEARNRPTWLAIPLGALDRLLGQPIADSRA